MTEKKVCVSCLPISRADGVLVLEMGAQSMSRAIDLSAFGARPGIGGPDTKQVLGAPAATCPFKVLLFICQSHAHPQSHKQPHHTHLASTP